MRKNTNKKPKAYKGLALIFGLGVAAEVCDDDISRNWGESGST